MTDHCLLVTDHSTVVNYQQKCTHYLEEEGNPLNLLTLTMTGLIIGGFVKWQLDQRKRRRRRGRLSQQLVHVDAPRREPIAQSPTVAHQPAQHTSAEPLSREMPADPEAALKVQTAAIVMDRLEAISGIGPAYARRLNEAGILTYTDLASLTPERLNQIISPGRSRTFSASDWITQARKLADMKIGD